MAAGVVPGGRPATARLSQRGGRRLRVTAAPGQAGLLERGLLAVAAGVHALPATGDIRGDQRQAAGQTQLPQARSGAGAAGADGRAGEHRAAPAGATLPLPRTAAGGVLTEGSNA